MTDLVFVPQPTREHLVRRAIAMATKSSARRRADVEIHREVPKWAKPLRRRARYKGSSGGRVSGKSHFFAEEAVEAMVADPSLRFLCIREVQSSLKFSAKSLIESKIRELGVEHLFNILGTEIRHAEGTGVMIFQGMQDHTAESIKSLEGFRIAWVEEAQSISKRSLDLLLPTIRAAGSEIWFSWNPDAATDAVDSFFKSLGLAEPGIKGDAVRVHSTYLDNPHCPPLMRTEAERLKAIDPEGYEHIWGGGYDLGGKGRVYSSFSSKTFPLGNVDDDVKDLRAELLVGMDFNVNPMSAVVAVRAGDECHVIDEIQSDTSNTEEMAAELKRRYPKRKIIVCPDPSGNARKTSAPVGQTDFTILRNAGFEVRAPSSAPLVVDRVNNSNAMFREILEPKTETKPGRERRRTRIHSRCTALIDALKQFAYKEGTSQPDKKGGFDHITDALGYLHWQEFDVYTPARTYGTSKHKV